MLNVIKFFDDFFFAVNPHKKVKLCLSETAIESADESEHGESSGSEYEVSI